MFNKKNLFILLASLLSTSAVSAMNNDYRKIAARQKLIVKLSDQRTESHKAQMIHTPAQEAKIQLIVGLFEERAEYFDCMIKTFDKHIKNLDPYMGDTKGTTLEEILGNEEIAKDFWSVFGLPLDHRNLIPMTSVEYQENPANYEHIGKMAMGIRDYYVKHHSLFTYTAILFKQRFAERPIFGQLAAIYLVALEMESAALDSVKSQKAQCPSEDHGYFDIKLQEDKGLFYRRVQKTILEEFADDIKEIQKELAVLAKSKIPEDLQSRSKKHGEKSKEDLTESQKQLYNDMIHHKYRFPSLESFSTLICFSEEEEIIDTSLGKKKKKRPKKNKASVAQTISQQPLQEESFLIPAETTQTKETEDNISGFAFSPEVENKIDTSLGKKKKKRPKKKKTNVTRPSADETNLEESLPILTETAPSIEGSPHPLQRQTEEENAHALDLYPKEIPQIPISQETNIFSIDNIETTKEIPCPQLKIAEPTHVTENTSLALEEHLTEETYDFEAIFSQDRKRKKQIPQITPLPLPVVNENKEFQLGIGEKKREILKEILAHPIKLDIPWSSIVTLFNSPVGFKGKVYGTNGSCNTFEVYLKFDKKKFAGFITEKEFFSFKANAEPERLNDRGFLPYNQRLQSYKVNKTEISAARSFFTLHNPHPQPCAYRELIERLQTQLALLGITPETIQEIKR